MLELIFIIAFITAIGSIVATLISIKTKIYFQKKLSELESLSRSAFEDHARVVKATMEKAGKIEAMTEDIKKAVESGRAQFIKLNDKRLAIYEKLYMNVMTLNFNLQDLVKHFDQINLKEMENEATVKLRKVEDLFNAFQMYFLDKKIHIEQGSSKLLEDLRTSYWTSLWNYRELHHMIVCSVEGEEPRLAKERARSAAMLVKQEILPVLERLNYEYNRLQELK